MIDNADMISFNIRRTILMVLFATMIIGYYWGLFFNAPSIVKFLFSMLIWCSIIVFPYKLIVDNTFSKTTNICLILLIFMGIAQTVRSIFSSDPLLHAYGNKWFTLFLNEYTMFLFVPPLFVYLGNRDEGLYFLMKSVFKYLLIGLFFIFIFEFPLAEMAIFVGVFYPYVDKRYKFLIVFSMIEAFLTGILSVRANLIILFFALSSYIVIYIIKGKIIAKLLCVIFAFAPSLLVFSILSMGESKESLLNDILEIVSSSSGDGMATDTRSILYIEMAQDLTDNESWLWGKGAYTHYHSDYFSRHAEDDSDRILCEVPFLNYLMHGGVAYAFFYFSLLLLGVYKGINSNNKFVRSVAIIAIGWFFNSFIGNLNGCRLYHLGFFLLLGICLSPHWCNKTDEEIVAFFKCIQ